MENVFVYVLSTLQRLNIFVETMEIKGFFQLKSS